jgi:hypothetical protein
MFFFPVLVLVLVLKKKIKKMATLWNQMIQAEQIKLDNELAIMLEQEQKDTDLQVALFLDSNFKGCKDTYVNISMIQDLQRLKKMLQYEWTNNKDKANMQKIDILCLLDHYKGIIRDYNSFVNQSELKNLCRDIYVGGIIRLLHAQTKISNIWVENHITEVLKALVDMGCDVLYALSLKPEEFFPDRESVEIVKWLLICGVSYSCLKDKCPILYRFVTCIYPCHLFLLGSYQLNPPSDIYSWTHHGIYDKHLLRLVLKYIL